MSQLGWSKGWLDGCIELGGWCQHAADIKADAEKMSTVVGLSTYLWYVRLLLSVALLCMTSLSASEHCSFI